MTLCHPFLQPNMTSEFICLFLCEKEENLGFFVLKMGIFGLESYSNHENARIFHLKMTENVRFSADDLLLDFRRFWIILSGFSAENPQELIHFQRCCVDFGLKNTFFRKKKIFFFGEKFFAFSLN